MTASYPRVDYALRPAKNIERKMMCEAFRRLDRFSDLKHYRYVGFGSTYFSDFLLLHRALGLEHMISIEHHIEYQERFEFNRPFDCVRMEFGRCVQVLPRLDWSGRTIAWLDYDSSLTLSVLADVDCVFSNASSESIAVITVNAHTGPREKRVVERLKDALGAEHVDAGLSDNDFRQWGTARQYYRILSTQINRTLRDRNAAAPQGERIEYRKLFRFHYADGARMLTTGGLLYAAPDRGRVQQCGFEQLEFCRSHPYKIEVPNLTCREIHHLESQMPCDSPAQVDAPGIPCEDVAKYSKVYRYFPTFAEAEI